jgi:peroxiredoxin
VAGIAAVVVALVAVVTVVVVGGDGSSQGARRGAGARTAGTTPEVTVVGPGAPVAGQAAPDFVLPALAGDGTVKLSDFKGEPVVVNFWASWCRPCRAEFPLLADARTRHRADGLEVIGVSYRDIPSDARTFAQEKKATWPLARDDRGAVASAYGVRAIPQTYFIRADGTVAARVFGITTKAELEENLKAILPTKKK